MSKTPSIPYGRQTIDEADLRAVAKALRSDWLTQGPRVAEFEAALARASGAAYAVAFSNGTAALQAAYAAAGLKSGDEFITTPLTFASTATAGLWQGARPVFADIDPATGNLDLKACEAALTSQTRALVPVDYAGLPADLEGFRALAKRKGLTLISDACHSLGATRRGKRVGSLADMTVFSFHPVKTITTGEGGAVVTDDAALRDRLASFRAHGIRKGADWEYFVDDMGLNYRLTDIQSALGLSQLKKLPILVPPSRFGRPLRPPSGRLPGIGDSPPGRRRRIGLAPLRHPPQTRLLRGPPRGFPSPAQKRHRSPGPLHPRLLASPL